MLKGADVLVPRLHSSKAALDFLVQRLTCIKVPSARCARLHRIARAALWQDTESRRECAGMKISRSMLAGASLLVISYVSAFGSAGHGSPGSPGATTTIDGKQLPPPDPNFGGVSRMMLYNRSRGGILASCRQRARHAERSATTFVRRRPLVPSARYALVAPRTSLRPPR